MYFVIADIKIIQIIKLTVQLVMAIIFRRYNAVLYEEIVFETMYLIIF